MFLGNGFVLASSYSRMPGIRDQLGSTPTQLAFALVCMGIGSILGMPFTGRLVDRYSSRMISLVATVICLGGWAALPMARSVPELALMLLITGVGAGVSGVAMNVQGLWRSAVHPVEILLGIITFATALGEGAANDWLALMLVDNRGAPPAVGALTFAGFNLTMAIGRFSSGVVIQRYGRAPVLRAAGILACTGVVGLCLVNSPLIALLGALAWGLGLSVVFPSAISAACEVPGRGSRAIAVVSTIGYGGFLFGAPLIGTLAHMMPLDRALLAVAVLVLLIAILASVARERGEESIKAKDLSLT